MKVNLGKMMFLGCLFLAFSLQMNAQETQSKSPVLQLSLEQAIDIALDKNPSIIVANQEIKKKDYSKKETLGVLFPQIDASGGYTHTLKKQSVVFQGNTMEMGTANQWSAGFSASMPIISPTLWKAINLKQTDVELALESARASKINTVSQVKDAFYSVLLAQDSYNVLKRSYDNATVNYNDVKNKFNNGIVAEFDMIRANVRVKNIEPNMLQAENAVNLTKMQLKVLMGIDMDVEIQPIGKLNDYEAEMLVSYMANDTSLVNNSDLKQFDIQQKMLQQNLSLQKTEFLPSLYGSFLYQWIALNDNFNVTDNNYRPYSTVGLTLSIPIFSGGSRINKIKQTKVSLSEMDTQRQDLVRNLQLAVRNYTDALAKSIEAAMAAKEGVNQAEKGYQISLKMYDTGMATMLEVNDADLARVNANLQYNQSIYEYLSSKSSLEQIIGKNY